jgi:hypothetical protein
MNLNLIPPAMNTKKLLFGILTIGILFGAACTTDNDEAYETSSIDRSKVQSEPKKSIDRSKVQSEPKKAIDRKKVQSKPSQGKKEN